MEPSGNVNCFMVFTNLLALPVIMHTRGWDSVLVTVAMLVSMFMHVSETKHSLPGIPPYSKYSWHFLQLDRIVAILTAIYLATRAELTRRVVGLAAVGLYFMALSELIAPMLGKRHRTTWYVVFHTLWHMTAYLCMYIILV